MSCPGTCTANTSTAAALPFKATGPSARVATRVAEHPDYGDIVRLEVQSRRFDPRTYFVSESGRVPLRVRVQAQCPVGRAE